MNKILMALAFVFLCSPMVYGQQKATKQLSIQVADHKATLTWNASTSTVSGYRVYRGTVSGGPYTLQATTATNVLTYVDNAVQSGQTYFWVVTAFDSMGVESNFSNQAQGTIP